jgi:phosphoglycerol transferase MdoB-like AlkP superfamily enzyme
MNDLVHIYKFFHVLSVIALGGGFVLEALCGPMVAKAKSVGEVRAYARLMYVSENFLSLPAALFIAGFGYATAGKENLDMGATWLILAQVLFYGIVALALVFLRPAANKLHKLAEAAPDGPVTPEIIAQVKQPLAAMVGMATSLMFVIIIYLMVVKPGS